MLRSVRLSPTGSPPSMRRRTSRSRSTRTTGRAPCALGGHEAPILQRRPAVGGGLRLVLGRLDDLPQRVEACILDDGDVVPGFSRRRHNGCGHAAEEHGTERLARRYLRHLRKGRDAASQIGFPARARREPRRTERFAGLRAVRRGQAAHAHDGLLRGARPGVPAGVGRRRPNAGTPSQLCRCRCISGSPPACTGRRRSGRGTCRPRRR